MMIGFVSALFWVILLFSIIPNKYNKFLSFFSSISFGLYLFHSPLVYITYANIPDANPIIVVLLNFMIWGTVAALFTIAISKSKIRFIIGE